MKQPLVAVAPRASSLGFAALKSAGCLAFACALVAPRFSAADDANARAALKKAFDRQAALPGYVEHQFGRMPVMPTADAGSLAGDIAARVKERVGAKVREKVSAATAQVPGGATVADSALARPEEEAADEELAVTLGPVTEVGTIEHTGKVQREIFPGGLGEIVRANGRMAYKLDLGPQIGQLRRAATLDTIEGAVAQARSVRDTIKSLAGLAETGVFGAVGLLIGFLDEARARLISDRSTAELLKVAAEMEKTSGKWQCQPDDFDEGDAGTVHEVRQLADEAIGGVPAHVYEEVRVFELDATMLAEAAAEGAAPAGDFRTQTRTWVRISDGLPLRSEFQLPSGDSQRTDYEYPANVRFTVPECLGKP